MIKAAIHRSGMLLPLVVVFLFCEVAIAQEKVRDEWDAVAKAYQIEVVTAQPAFPIKTRHGAIDGKEAAAKDLEHYAGLFATEFKLYPTDLIKRSKLKRVVICVELSFGGQPRTAIPDWDGDTLYLDAARGMHNKTYVRKVIHHEYFHIIDFRDDGLVYKDERWQALNPADFKYGSGGKNAQDLKETSLLTDKYPGFLNHYSTTGVEEDKAEVFAHLMVEPGHLEERSKKDPVLKAKTQRMRELLKNFCPDMHDKYWDAIKKAERN